MSDSESEPRPPHEQPVHAEFQHRAVTARIREEVGTGVFANAAIVLSGQFEFVIDFLLRMGKPERVSARVVLPILVAEQFVLALQDSIGNYERQFGPLQEPRLAAGNLSGTPAPPAVSSQTGDQPPAAAKPAAASSAPGQQNPTIDELYEDFKLQDVLLGGAYANAVLIRHSATEFCFDFVFNVYPRSSVNARVFMAAPQVKPLWNSLSHSVQQYRRRFGPRDDFSG